MQTNQNNQVVLDHLGKGQASSTSLLWPRAQGPSCSEGKAQQRSVFEGTHLFVAKLNFDEQRTNRE